MRKKNIYDSNLLVLNVLKLEHVTQPRRIQNCF